MRFFRIAFVVLVLLFNFAIAQPSFANPKLTATPEYTEVTQALDNLLKAKDDPNQSDYSPEEIQQKIGNLRLQKYILETSTDWAQCRNETAGTLAVYAGKPKKSEASTLYYLGAGQATDDDWNCSGIYLPTGAKVAGLLPGDAQGKDLAVPIALKIVPGTQFVATTNPETNAVEFNVSPAQILRSGESDWTIPDLSQVDIDAAVPNAPVED